MLDNFLNFIYHYKIFNPIMRIILPHISQISYLNQFKREKNIVVSISAEEESFDNLEYTLYSVFNQRVLPDNVILWISDEYELSDLPYTVTKFIKYGLDVRFVKNLDSYTKITYALKEYKNSVIVTADENIYYPKSWLSKLYLSYISNPNCIHVHTARGVTLKSGRAVPDIEWTKYISTENASYKYFPETTGGILYPPGCFIKDVLREDIYKNKVNTSWEVWSWVMSLVSGRKICIVKNHINRFSTTNIRSSFRKYKNIINQQKMIDAELAKLFSYYGNNIKAMFSQE